MKNLIEYINESVSSSSNHQYPSISILGNGEFDGILWGHCFLYNGKKYHSESGWSNMFPSYCKMIIKDNNAFPKQVDEYQYPELKELFNDKL